MLDVDVVTIGVESAASSQPRLPLHGIQMLRRGMVDELLGLERDSLLRADAPGEPALFGAAAGLVRSQALLRLAQSLGAMKQKEMACATLAEVGRKYPRASGSVKQGVEREQKRVHC